MGSVDFTSPKMKRLIKLLDQHFPETTDELSSIVDSPFSDWSENRNKILVYFDISVQSPDKKKLSYREPHDPFSVSHLVIPEYIEKQRISAQHYGASLRFFLDRYKKENSNSYIDDICAEVCIQRTHLYKMLKGERRPSRDLAIAFCFALRIDLAPENLTNHNVS